MFVGITNTPRDYAWGSTRAIADLLGHTPSGGPEADLWLGAHAGSPSVIEDAEQAGGSTDLAGWIAASPAAGARRSDSFATKSPFRLGTRCHILATWVTIVETHDAKGTHHGAGAAGTRARSRPG